MGRLRGHRSDAPTPGARLAGPVARGAAAGLVGAAMMTAAEKVEQTVTKRPDSFVPGHTLRRLLRVRRPDKDSRAPNWGMHFGTGTTVGVRRGVMAYANLRGTVASLLFCGVRLSVDQTLENATGAGAPPASWPRDELIVDLAGKAVYALATGVVADAWIAPRPGNSPARAGLGSRLKGF